MQKRIGTARLIGIAGLIGSGKDTTANIITALRPRAMRRYAFARPLKEGVKAMFGWDDDMIEDRVLKEKVDEFWGFSPRTAMIFLGTEYGRNLLRQDIWIKAAEKFHNTTLEKNLSTIITDVRFQNEAEWIRSQPDSVIVHVIDPTYVIPNTVRHVSEQGVEILEDDVVICNNKIEGLKALETSVLIKW